MSGIIAREEVVADEIASHGEQRSISLLLPPLAVVMLKAQNL